MEPYRSHSNRTGQVQERPMGTFHGMNPQEREGKLAALRWDPLGPRPVVDFSAMQRPAGFAYRKDEKAPVHEMPRVPTTAASPGVRIRLEPNNRDAMNGRLLEAMPFSAARLITPEQNAKKPFFQDMNPLPSRIGTGDYSQSRSFFPNAELQRNQAGQVIPNASPQLPGRWTDNPYLQSMDAAGEPRQLMRELQASVKEDNREKYIDMSQKLASRNFSHSWLPAAEAKNMMVDNLQAYELLKPKFDDYTKNYRSTGETINRKSQLH